MVNFQFLLTSTNQKQMKGRIDRPVWFAVSKKLQSLQSAQKHELRIKIIINYAHLYTVKGYINTGKSNYLSVKLNDTIRIIKFKL